MKRDDVDTFFRILAAANPEPKTELIATNPYTLLVAVVLSAQATDASVNRATASLFKKIDHPKAMVALGEDGLKEHIKTIGLYNAKAKNIIALSEKLLNDFAGAVPRTREALQSLPGVGRKTANVVLNVVYGEPVDTHVFRVANRTGMARGKTPEAVEEGLLKVIPKKWMQHAHHWLILHGRYTCTARAPKCGECVVRDYCGWEEKALSRR
jgi:endonuclease III